jgi:hypothetical protein
MKKVFEKALAKTLVTIITGALLLMLVYGLSSCARNGYGCSGRSKCMTRVR